MPEDMYASLERVFHEPNRLSIVSALISEADGLSFSQLKASCQLTDGNLSRHLKHLEEKGIVNLHKEFRDSKPLTTARMTEDGRQKFMTYLQALEKVLKRAAKAAKSAGVSSIQRGGSSPGAGRKQPGRA